jgi:hypothetical protein
MLRRTCHSTASLLVVLLATGPLSIASQAAETKSWTAPRTAFGQPDLQGNWTNATLTPLERAPKYGDRLVLSKEEAKAIEGEEANFNAVADAPTDPKLKVQDLPKECGKGFSGTNCGYNNFWVDAGTQLITLDGGKRSSIITDPANGRLPPLKPEAQKRLTELFAAFRSGGTGAADGPEVRSLGERCILSFGSSAGPPMLPLLYNNNYQIVQTKDAVMILVEMVHDTRVIRLGGQHAPSSVRTWMGDSIGHWEGDTLVVETANFRKEVDYRGSSENLKVTEWIKRVAPNKIHYRFTVENPDVYNKPWSGELAMNATRDNIFEYACHEGNYALPGILAGARAAEKEAAPKKN